MTADETEIYQSTETWFCNLCKVQQMEDINGSMSEEEGNQSITDEELNESFEGETNNDQ